MRLHSPHTPKEYILAMKERMGSRFAIGSERFTGIIIGRLFYVTHHAGYEWDRRITCQTNTAWGYVKKSAGSCEVRFLKAKGWLCPHLLLLYILLLHREFIRILQNFYDMPFLLWISFLLFIVFIPFITTAFEAMTEGSISGEKSLLGLLKDPADYLAYLNHQNELG